MIQPLFAAVDVPVHAVRRLKEDIRPIPYPSDTVSLPLHDPAEKGTNKIESLYLDRI